MIKVYFEEVSRLVDEYIQKQHNEERQMSIFDLHGEKLC